VRCVIVWKVRNKRVSFRSLVLQWQAAVFVQYL
jgi:hypothetical protein